MNWFEHHIGDYDQATAHLSAVEDGIYSRLIRRYMATELPLPSDITALQRLVRARSRDEKAAVKTILSEFFKLTADGYRQHRCDEEIERYQGRRSKAKASADARWSRVPTGDAPDMRTHDPSIAPDMRTHDPSIAQDDATVMPPAGAPAAHPGAGARPSPLPTTHTHTQTPENQGRAATAETVARPPEDGPSPEVNGHPPTTAGAMCRAMRQAGLQQTNPSDPRLLALIEQGATEGEFRSVAAEAAAGAKGWPWVLKVVEARRNEAAAIALSPRHPRGPPAASFRERDAAAAAARVAEFSPSVAAKPPRNHLDYIDAEYKGIS